MRNWFDFSQHVKVILTCIMQLSINLHFKYSQSSRDRDFQYLYCKGLLIFPMPAKAHYILASHYQQYTEQNFVLDVEIKKKLGKPHGPRPSNCTSN